MLNIPTVLIVEDNAEMAELLSIVLGSRGFNTELSSCGQAALDYCSARIPDVVVLDLTLPDIDGMEVCQRLKSMVQMETVPILICSARSETSERVRCLDLGADDYITKPFDPSELIARIKVQLRRFGHGIDSQDNKKLLYCGLLKLDPNLRQVYWNKQALCALTRSECDIFYILVQQAGKFVNREEIAKTVLGQEYDPSKRTIDMHVAQIRKKLGEDVSKHLVTISKKGYQWHK